MSAFVLLDQAKPIYEYTALIAYTSLGISEDERQAYRAAVDETLARCTPLPFSHAFGSVIAGRPIYVRFHS